MVRKKLKLTRLARKITGFKEPFELTTNFSYFVKKCLGYNSTYSNLGLTFFTMFAGSVFYWIPSCNIKNRIVYIPRFCLLSENRFVGFLVHEINHLKYPTMREIAVNTMSNQEVKEWRNSIKI